MDTPLQQWLEAAWSQHASVGAVEVEGATVRYRGWGLEQTSRPGLFLVHGFLAHARWWDHIAPHLSDRFRVVAPDFTGMGDSDRRPVYDRRQYSRELLAVADHAGIERATLVAHSFGALSALYAARLAPERAARVIVLDARIFRLHVEPDTDEESLVKPETFHASREEALARYRLLPPGAWPDPWIIDYIAEHSLRETPHGWGWKFDPGIFRSVHKGLSPGDVRGLGCPVDFIYGANSELVGEAEIAEFVAKMPSCPGAVSVPLSHHHVMIEQPIGLVAALNGLLRHRG